MKKLLIASNNQGKIREFKRMLGGFYDEVLSLRDAGIKADVIEDGTTFYENARIKALQDIVNKIKGATTPEAKAEKREKTGKLLSVKSVVFKLFKGNIERNVLFYGRKLF